MEHRLLRSSLPTCRSPRTTAPPTTSPDWRSRPGSRCPRRRAATVDLAGAASGRARLVAYVYPRTGVPGEPSPAGWDDIPGARGCTPQSCAFRDSLAEFAALGASVLGISAQTAGRAGRVRRARAHPLPAARRPGLRLAGALRLPTFEVEGMTLYRRLTLVADAGRDRQGLLPRLPARPQRRRGARLAAGGRRARRDGAG